VKTFRFQLQKVLDLKEKEKEQAEWALGESVQRRNEEETKLYQLAEHHEQMTNMLHSVQASSCSAAQLIEITRYRQSVERSIAAQRRTLFGCEQEVEQRKHRLTERMQEMQLWQRLREKAREHFVEAEKSHEQKWLDEIGTQLYLRRSW
jgi:flagellar FliJ protein